MSTQALLKVAEAAKRVGVTRQTIFKKVKRGQLASAKDGQGYLVIDESELLRVYGQVLTDEEISRSQARKAPRAIPLMHHMEMELEFTKLRLLYAEERIESLTRQLGEASERERLSHQFHMKLYDIIDKQLTYIVLQH